SLPYTTEGRLVSVGMLTSLDSNEFFTGEDYRKWRTAQTPFEAITAMAAVAGSSMSSGINPGGNCDVVDENPVRVNCAYVDSNFLSTFGIQPLLGHDLSESDINVPVANVSLVTYPFWKTHFSGAAEVLGKIISIDGHPTTIIGILPAEFEMPNLGAADLLVPL